MQQLCSILFAIQMKRMHVALLSAMMSLDPRSATLTPRHFLQFFSF